MNKEQEILLGLAGSAVVCTLWRLWPGHTQFKAQLYKLTSPEEPEKSPLAFVEHYHWGLASIIVGQSIQKYANLAYGFGSGMILSEVFGEQPFGIGKSEYEVTGNFVLGTALGGALVLMYSAR